MASSKRDKTSTDGNKSADDYNFYRVYSKDGTPVPVNQLFNFADSHLGCFTAKDIGPPHLALNVRRFLCKLEKIPTTTATALYKDIHSVEPLGDRDRVDLSRSEGRKSKALVVKFLDEPQGGSEDVKEPDKPAPAVPKSAPAPVPSTLLRRPASGLCGITCYIGNINHSQWMSIGDPILAPSGETEYSVLVLPSHLGPKQRWTAEDAGNGEVYLKSSVGEGYYLTNDGGLALSTRRGRDDKWEVQPSGRHSSIMAAGTRLFVATEVIYRDDRTIDAIKVTSNSQPNGTSDQMWGFTILD